ncbi:28365_t:CDS:2 [Dentiscutata erythropus]|uniref:28365_t:CDS:1 n=1 Tax=Dentiscutata erythropus TaxID=1348616 RepID=A0A9N9E286_9GLOM|nr:28365_t:CDS:2 [Dentiscutata erythropus]
MLNQSRNTPELCRIRRPFSANRFLEETKFTQAMNSNFIIPCQSQNKPKLCPFNVFAVPALKPIDPLEDAIETVQKENQRY